MLTYIQSAALKIVKNPNVEKCTYLCANQILYIMYAIKKIFAIFVAVADLIAAVFGTIALFSMDVEDGSNVVYGFANIVLALCAAPVYISLVKSIFNHG